MANPKVSWSANAGTMTFIMSGGTFSVAAETIDRPNTLCELADIAADKLRPTELKALAGILESMSKKPKEG